jgi:hypothetical protein
MLFSTKYSNIKVLQEEVRKNVKFYVVELLPLEGEETPTSLGDVPYEDEFGSYD